MHVKLRKIEWISLPGSSLSSRIFWTISFHGHLLDQQLLCTACRLRFSRCTSFRMRVNSPSAPVDAHERSELTGWVVWYHVVQIYSGPWPDCCWVVPVIVSPFPSIAFCLWSNTLRFSTLFLHRVFTCWSFRLHASKMLTLHCCKDPYWNDRLLTGETPYISTACCFVGFLAAKASWWNAFDYRAIALWSHSKTGSYPASQKYDMLLVFENLLTSSSVRKVRLPGQSKGEGLYLDKRISWQHRVTTHTRQNANLINAVICMRMTCSAWGKRPDAQWETKFRGQWAKEGGCVWNKQRTRLNRLTAREYLQQHIQHPLIANAPSNVIIHSILFLMMALTKHATRSTSHTFASIRLHACLEKVQDIHPKRRDTPAARVNFFRKRSHLNDW